MAYTDTVTATVTDIDRELDWARSAGPVRTIVIPPCPELLARLQIVMAEADPDWDAVGAIAAADVAMAASLVRAANSPLYARGREVEGVPQAMSLLGLRQTAALLTNFLAARAMPVNHPLLAHFWLSSSRRALAMGYVARQLYGTPPDLAHTLGLFCDVGIPLLLQGLRGYAGTLVEARARQDRTHTATEQAAHKTDHTIVGALVARTWSLAPALKVAIRLHHDAEALADRSVDETLRTLVAACTVADHLVQAHDGQPDAPEWIQRGADCLHHLQVSADELVLWQDALQPVLDHIQ
jgi:HD-like signal output (HDOD) protein